MRRELNSRCYGKTIKHVLLCFLKNFLSHIDLLGPFSFVVFVSRMEHKLPYSNGYHLSKNNYSYLDPFKIDVSLFEVIQVVFVVPWYPCSHKWSICIYTILVLCSLLEMSICFMLLYAFIIEVIVFATCLIFAVSSKFSDTTRWWWWSR